MTTVAQFTADPDTFPFGRLFELFPEATVELERIVPSNGHPVPYIWLRGPPAGEVQGGFDDHPEIASIELIDSVEDEHLFRVRWTGDRGGLLSAVLDSGVTFLSAVGTASEWTTEVRGDRDQVAAFQSACEDHGVSVTLTSLHSLGPSDPTDEYGLTEPQHEALATAYSLGYFDHPRRATLGDVAEELGISRQALSDRLKRGSHNLVENTIAVG